MDCDIEGNACSLRGGGIHVENCNPTITDCSISFNACTTPVSDTGGGGIYSEDDSSPAISGCRILFNDVHAWGGGIDCDNNTTITDCIISGNEAHYAGGISCGGNTVIENCHIIGNSATTGTGGGINSRDNVSVISSVISRNLHSAARVSTALGMRSLAVALSLKILPWTQVTAVV